MERAWWADVNVAGLWGASPYEESARIGCWTWARENVSVSGLGRSMHVRRAILLMLRPELVEEAEPWQRIAPGQDCDAPATRWEVGCVNPWHQELVKTAKAMRDEKILMSAADHRAEEIVVDGEKRTVGDQSELAFHRLARDPESVREIIDSFDNTPNKQHELYKRYIRDARVYVEMLRLMEQYLAGELDYDEVGERVSERMSQSFKPSIASRLADAMESPASVAQAAQPTPCQTP